MKSKKSATCFALPGIIIVTALGFSAAHAANDTWNQSTVGTYNWIDTANWLSATQFPNGSGDAADITANLGTGATIINLNQNITLGTLSMGKASQTLTIAPGTPAGRLVFDASSGSAALNVVAGAANTISAGIVLADPLAVTSDVAASLSGGVFGYGNLTKTGAGALTFGANTTFFGNIAITQGTLGIGSFAVGGTTSVDVASGATFSFNNNSTARTLAGLTGAGTVSGTSSGEKRLTINNAVDNVFTGTITYAGGAGTSNLLTKTNTGKFTLSGAGNFVGTGTPSFLEARNGSFVLDNTGTNNTNRIANTIQLNLGGGEFALVGNASAASSETMAAVTVLTNSGSILTVTPGSGQSATFTGSSLALTTGSTGSSSKTSTGGVLFRGTGLGTAVAGTANTSNIFFTTAPSLTGGGGLRNTPAIGIIRFALGDTSSTGSGSGLVTYDLGADETMGTADDLGVRLLNTTTEFAAYGNVDPLTNQKITTGGTSITGQTVNSLLLTASGDTTIITTPLVLTSGALVYSGSGAASLLNGTGGSISVTDRSAYVSVTDASGVLTLNGIAITTGTSGTGLVKQGAGTLLLTGQVTSAANNAGYIVAAGTLKAGNTNTLIRNTSSVGEVLRVQNGAIADMAGLAQSSPLNGYISIVAGGILTNTGANALFTTNGGNTNTTSTIAGTVTDGTPVDGNATGVVSLAVGGGADGQTLTLTHGGHVLGSLTNNADSSASHTLNMASVSSTDDNTIYGTVLIDSRGSGDNKRLFVNTVANSATTVVAKTLGTAAITLDANGTTANPTLLSIASRGETAALTAANTLVWTNNVNVTSGGTGRAAAVTVGSSDSGVSSGVTQQLGTLSVGGASTVFTVTANNNYTLEFTGATTLTNGTATTHTFDVAVGTLALNAISESGTGAKGLTKTGTGTLVIKGAATHTGLTTVSAGSLHIGAGSTTGSISSNITNNAAVVFNRSNDSTYAGAMDGTGTLTKQGAGALTLSNANTYSGATSVTGGKLLVNGTHITTTAGSAYSVTNTNSTLGGNGRLAVNGSVSVGSGAYLAPGASIGTLTLDGANTAGNVLTLDTGSKFAFELAGDGGISDQLALWNYNSGDLGLNSNVIDLSLLGTQTVGTYNVDIFKFFIDGGGTAATHAFTSELVIGSLGAGISSASIDWNGTGNNNQAIALTYTVVPETNVASLIGGFGTLLLLRRRRRA